jgi:uncharacterized DUF497 family protein
MNEDDFEWDPKKAAINYADHGISFEIAREVFDDPAHIDRYDDREDYGEARFNATGEVKGRILVVTYTVRGAKIRLISARLAEPYERRRYHEEKR